MTLATTIYLAPRIQMNFFTFRGIHGNTVQRYTNLLANDIILERGFSSVTWQPLKAIEYAKGDGQDPPSYLMCVGLPSNSHALSVYCVSAYPNDREFLLPAGTVLEKTTARIHCRSHTMDVIESSHLIYTQIFSLTFCK